MKVRFMCPACKAILKRDPKTSKVTPTGRIRSFCDATQKSVLLTRVK